MKRAILCSLVLGGLVPAAQAFQGGPARVRWETNFDTARQAAAKAGKPLLVDFYATWCGPCRALEEQTFADPAVKALLQRVVCVRLDIDRRPPLAEKYEVSSIPRVLLLPAAGDRPQMDVLGFRDAKTFARELREGLGLKADEPAAPSNPDAEAVRQALQEGRYPALKEADPRRASAGLNQLAAGLGVFKEAELEPAIGLLRAAGDDGVTALIQALGHEHLAVRAGAYRALQAILRDRKVGLPFAFDPWAPAARRQAEMQRWARWWQGRRQ